MAWSHVNRWSRCTKKTLFENVHLVWVIKNKYLVAIEKYTLSNIFFLYKNAPSTLNPLFSLSFEIGCFTGRENNNLEKPWDKNSQLSPLLGVSIHFLSLQVAYFHS